MESVGLEEEENNGNTDISELKLEPIEDLSVGMKYDTVVTVSKKKRINEDASSVGKYLKFFVCFG